MTTHHDKVSAKKTPPTTITKRPIGRSNAARVTLRCSSGESRRSPVAPDWSSGLFIALGIAFGGVWAVLQEGQAHAPTRLKPECPEGVSLVDGEAQSPVGVRN